MQKVIIILFTIFLLNCDRDISTNPALGTMDISFTMTGGFAGIHNSMLIDATGYVTSIFWGDTASVQLSVREHRELLALFDDFLSLDKAEYVTNYCIDMFYYKLTLLETRTENEIHSVRTEDCYLREKANLWDRLYLSTLVNELLKLQSTIHNDVDKAS